MSDEVVEPVETTAEGGEEQEKRADGLDLARSLTRATANMPAPKAGWLSSASTTRASAESEKRSPASTSSSPAAPWL